MSVGMWVLVALGSGVGAGLLAQSKGRGYTPFAVLGFLLPVVGLLVAAVVTPDRGRQLTPAGSKGWHRDPTGRFDRRFFDGRGWTRHVERGSERFEDVL